MNRFFIILVCSFVGASAARSEMTADSRDLLIEKLSQVQTRLSPKDPSNVPVTLRLADLLSDRARLDSMKELESGCTVCKAGAKDRKLAMKLYQEVLDRTPSSSKGKVLIQLGHLSQLNSNEEKAVTFYQQALNSSSAADIESESHLALAEIYFKRHDFLSARNHYEKVL
ncbi:MAG: hypothetical protein COT73_03970, partial [Bdellovibrio sp. CG10_big_fil_rev_8_21_14_0_10_47_8]